MTKKKQLKELIQHNYALSIGISDGAAELAHLFGDVTEKERQQIKSDYLLASKIIHDAIYEKVDSLSRKEVKCLLRVLTRD